MSSKPTPRFTVITLGVTDMRASIAFYEALGFTRKMRATGEAVAFFDTGGTVVALFPWDQLAREKFELFGAGNQGARKRSAVSGKSGIDPTPSWFPGFVLKIGRTNWPAAEA